MDTMFSSNLSSINFERQLFGYPKAGPDDRYDWYIDGESPRYTYLPDEITSLTEALNMEPEELAPKVRYGFTDVKNAIKNIEGWKQYQKELMDEYGEIPNIEKYKKNKGEWERFLARPDGWVDDIKESIKTGEHPWSHHMTKNGFRT